MLCLPRISSPDCGNSTTTSSDKIHALSLDYEPMLPPNTDPLLNAVPDYYNYMFMDFTKGLFISILFGFVWSNNHHLMTCSKKVE